MASNRRIVDFPLVDGVMMTSSDVVWNFGYPLSREFDPNIFRSVGSQSILRYLYGWLLKQLIIYEYILYVFIRSANVWAQEK